MKKWLAELMGKSSDEPHTRDDANEARRLRLELAERDETIARLRGELERHQRLTNASVADRTRAQVEQLASGIAVPLSQLFTQIHLLGEGQSVRPQDLSTVAQRLIVALADNGLALEGQIGEAVPFDPNRHEPLSADQAPRPGQSVVIRFPGVVYEGRLLHKASVEIVPESST